MTAQQLKNSILQMAVQGKLVPQDPSDEPASVLLQRIKAEKQELIKAGKIKKDKKSSEIFRGASRNLPYAFCEQIGKEIRDISDEIPFEIPDSWEWCRLDSAVLLTTDYVANGSFATLRDNVKSYKEPNYAILVKTQDFSNNFTQDLTYTDKKGYDFLSKSELHGGELMLSNIGASIGKAFIIPKLDIPMTLAPNSIMVKCINSTMTFYIQYLIMSFYGQILLKSFTEGTAMPKFSKTQLRGALIPIPPLSEQERIVAKIEELLPYIERYGKAEEHLTALNTTFPEALKKSILQEAVQGKLVPQNPDDEPASVLLERIRAEKQALIKAGKIKKDKHESVIVTRDKIPYEIIDGKERCIADEVPFELPESWCWCRLGDILLKLTDGTHSTPKYTESGISFISVKDVSSGKLDFSNCKHISEKEHTELYDRCNPEIGDILLTKVGTTGIPVIVDTDLPFSLFVSVALLKFNQELLYNKYLLYMINSPLVQKQAAENTKGVGNKNWVMRDIANTLIVIPPIDEQHRIVAKIEEIMPYINTITK